MGVASAQTVYTPYTISTLAGEATSPGSANGTGNNALFAYPEGVAVDSVGNLYVADSENNLIRMVTPAGAVTTLAGTALVTGSTNGSAASALFNYPTNVAVDSLGNVYVGDTSNYLVRKITPTVSGGTTSWAVTTLAGSGSIGHADATGTAASFAGPQGVAVDSVGNVYVVDEGNRTIRKITAAGVVSTIAGAQGVTGSANGTGTAAQFNEPVSLAVDSAGNLYVADTGNSEIRKITPAGVVTTLAGSPTGAAGSTDGTGTAARFNIPVGVAVDNTGNVYVADTLNDTIRRITPAGVVTTLAGLAGSASTTDGLGAKAEFYDPYGVAVDSTGNLYIADTFNDTIRKGVGPLAITQQPANQTTILGGSATFTVAPAGSSYTYQWQLNGVAISGATSSSYTVTNVQASNSGPGNLYTVVVSNGATSATSNAATITLNNETAPTVANPAAQTANAGGTVVLTAAATGGGLSYQWYFDGSSISGATGASLTLANIGTEQAGYYALGVSNAAGQAISSNVGGAGLVTVNYSARLNNLSSRAYVGTGSNSLIAGFGIAGIGTKNLLLRGVGPGLAATFPSLFSASSVLATPQLTLYDGGSIAIVADAGWGNSFTSGASTVHVSPQAATAVFMNSVGAFSLATGSADSAMEVTPAPASYSEQVSGVNSTSGIALAEIYDADAGTPAARLDNLSTRANVGLGGNSLIGGFTITGTTSETVLIRGVGPGLATTFPSLFSSASVLATPELILYDGNSIAIATDIGWGNAAALGTSPVQAGVQPATATVLSEVGAFPLTTGSADCAIVVTLPPGNYTAQVTGVGGATGIALIEVYEVP